MQSTRRSLQFLQRAVKIMSPKFNVIRQKCQQIKMNEKDIVGTIKNRSVYSVGTITTTGNWVRVPSKFAADKTNKWRSSQFVSNPKGFLL